jgi:hypothetical protein
MFNGQRIVVLCKSLTVNAINFLKVGNGYRLTALKQFLTMCIHHNDHREFTAFTANIIYKSIIKNCL